MLKIHNFSLKKIFLLEKTFEIITFLESWTAQKHKIRAKNEIDQALLSVNTSVWSPCSFRRFQLHLHLRFQHLEKAFSYTCVLKSSSRQDTIDVSFWWQRKSTMQTTEPHFPDTISSFCETPGWHVGNVANHFRDGTSFKNQGLKLYPVSPGSQPFCIFPVSKASESWQLFHM